MNRLLRTSFGMLPLALAAPATSAEPCHVGAFQLSGGQLVTIGPTSDGSLRYRLLNGGVGRLYLQKDGSHAGGPGWASKPPPVVSALAGTCGSDNIRFRAPGVPEQTATRAATRAKMTMFNSGGLSLRGRLVMPPGNDKVPLVVLVHGSEETSAVDLELEQYWLPARGVAVFVYDKRGTGQSQGKYTQDFHVLSGDAVAALQEGKRLLGKRAGPAGFWGSSQGGWIAPLAAQNGKADFVVVAYGLAQTPLDEDREQVLDNLRRAGYGPDVLSKAREITDATGAVIASRFTSGFEALEAVKAKYRDEPWLKAIKGEFTGILLSVPTAAIKEVGPTRDQGTSWTYDPLPVLKALDIPMLWVLAGEDVEAPSATTLGILKAMQPTEPELDIALFPEADHGMIRFVEKEGKRERIGLATSYQPLVLHWLKTHRLRAGTDAVLYSGGSSGGVPLR